MAAKYEHAVDIHFSTSGALKTQAEITGVDDRLTKFDQAKHDETIAGIGEGFRETGLKANDAGKKIKDAGGNIYDGTKNASAGMNQFINAARRALIVAPVWMAIRSAMMLVSQIIQDQIKFMIELETAMARIQIVGKGTAEEFILLKDSLVALSFAYGISATKAAQAAMIFAQQGKSVQETLYLTQQAMLTAQILGVDVVTVVDDLTAAMNGFGISGEKSIGIIDKWVSVEKEFAVTSKDLAEATKVAGATANQMGITLSEFLGDVTSVIEVTRKSGSEAARGLSFIYARLLTTGKPVIEQIARVKFYLDEQGKATNTLSTNLRSHASILGDLATKWDKLSKAERLSVAESLGSKRQMVILNALMQNYNRSIDARIIALTSAGSSEKSFNIIQETTAYKLQQVGSAWNNLTNAIGDTSGFKIAIDGVSSLLTRLTFLINTEKGYRLMMSKPIAEERAKITASISELGNIKELIRLRKQLSENPIENAVRIENINKGLETMFKNQKIKPLEIPAKIDAKIDENTKRDIRNDIKKVLQEEYNPKIRALQENIKSPILGKPFFDPFGLQKKSAQELIKVQQEYNTKLKEQTAIALANYDAKVTEEDEPKLIAREEKDLIDKTKERMDMDFELAKLKITQKDNAELLLQTEIKLLENSKYQYLGDVKTLEVSKLQQQLALQKLETSQKLVDSARTLAMQYEKSDMFQKNDLRRVSELAAMSPQELVSVYEDDMYDKDMILEYWSYFSDAAKSAIEKVAIELNDLPGLNMQTDEEKLSELYSSLERNTGIKKTSMLPQMSKEQYATITNNIVNKGAENISVQVTAPTTTPEEMMKKIEEAIKVVFLTDKNVIRLFGKKVINEVDTE